jgi:polysaccharide biosynthesis transport protein
MLRRRRKTAIITLLLFELAGIAVLLFITRRYEASSIIQLEKSGYSGLDMDSLMGAAAGGEDSLSVNSDLQTQANILESPGLVLQVAQKLNLESTYEFQSHFNILNWAIDLVTPSDPPEPPGLSLDKSPRRQRTILRRFKKDLSTDVIPGTRLIEIKVATPDPVQAANINNALVQALIEYNSRARYDATAGTSKWLEGQLDDLKKQSEANRAKLVNVQKETGLFGLGGTDSQGKAGIYSPVLDKLQQTEQALSQAEENRFLKEAVYHAVKSGNPEAISQLGGTAASGTGPGVMNSLNLLQSLHEQEATLRAQIGKDANVYGDRYPRLTSEREALQKVNDAIKEETNRIMERAEKDYTIAVEAERAARAEYESERGEATKLNNKTIDYVLLEKEADQSDGLYQSLLRRLREAGMLEGAQSTSISIVDDARPPAKPEKPNMPLLIVGIILLGPAFAYAAASLHDSLDNKLQDVEALEKDGYALLGVLPQFKSTGVFTFGQSGPRALFQESMRRARTVPLLRSNGASPHVEGIPDVSPVDEDDPNSPFSEAMRRIRSTILLANGSRPPQVLLIASGSPGEGKTTVTMALGRSLTQLGKRVLIVEADLRRPSLREK